MPDFTTGSWSSNVPIAADAWTRAIYKRAPSHFHVRLLPPEKHGGSYGYGFRVSAIKDDNASIVTHTTSSTNFADEYDVWRKWEDCLIFQDSLEVEYARAAREKRKRLAAGKGVKKNGVYIHSDQAASWESLPFGPDPHDIAHNIHEYIPKLSKKGTLFRASQETIDRRFEELRKMMHVLLQDDLPVLIKEIKATFTFSDFFSVWRMDVDLARKAASKKPSIGRLRTSPSLNSLSAPPVSPAPSTKSACSSKGKSPLPLPPIHSDSSCSDDSVDPRESRQSDRKRETRTASSRGSSSDSQASSSVPSTPVTMPRQLPSTSRQPAIASQEMPARFDHNPHVPGGPSFLESLPEDRELSSSPKSNVDGHSPRKSGNANRSARVYVPPPSNFVHPSELSSQPPPRHCRASLQSMHSATLRAAAYLDELDVDYCLPAPIPEPPCRSRASVSSIASVMTNYSVDAVIPRNERPSGFPGHNAQRSVSCSEEPWVTHEPWSGDESDEGDILNAYFSDLIRPRAPTPDVLPETPTMDERMYRFSQAQSSSATTLSSFSRFSDRRSSVTTVSSGSTSSSGNPTSLSIKAMHEDKFIILRVPRNIAFDHLRRKIYDKFIQTDNATICQSFAVALMSPAEQAPSVRPRADSLSSLGSGPAKGTALHFISSQDEWDDIAATHCGKVFLRIIGSRE